MKHYFRLIAVAAVTGFLAATSLVSADELTAIQLPPPQITGGMSLMQALQGRKTMRTFSPRALPLPVLSDLLWAANGINRPANGHHTAPTAMNMEEIDIYVATADGLYLYNPGDHVLESILAEDIRAVTGLQGFVKDAPVNLIFVADRSRMGRLTAEDADFYEAVDTGYISQNVYLYCAAAGLATVVRGRIDRPALAKAMKLRGDQKIILAQTVGYPGGTTSGVE